MWKSIPDFPNFAMCETEEVKNLLSGNFTGSTLRILQDGKRVNFNIDKLHKELSPFVSEWKDIPQCPTHEMHRDKRIRCKRTGLISTTALVLWDGKKRVRVNYYLAYERLFVSEDELPYKQIIHSLKLKYPHLTFDEFYKQSPCEREILMIIKFPELLEDWADISEVGNIYYGSVTLRKWKCNDHGYYKLAVHTRGMCGLRCPGCTVWDTKCAEVGAITERNVAKILEKLPIVKDVECVGQLGNPPEDLIATLTDGTRRSIQVKTLSHFIGDRYGFAKCGNYPEDMLIIAIDETMTKFFCALRGEITTRESVGLTYTKYARTYKANKFTDMESFMARIEEYLPKTLEFVDNDDRYSDTYLKEVKSRRRFIEFADKNGLNYKDAEHNGSPIDGYVNGLATQFKYIGGITPEKSTYHCGIQTTRNGKRGSYAKSDNIDLFIFEIGECEGRFLIIPSFELLDRGFLTDEFSPGKPTINIPPPNYTPIRASTLLWMLKYWDNLDPILNPRRFNQEQPELP